MGCPITVEYTSGSIRTVNGNQCKLGLEYAEKEVHNPERILTTTVRVKQGHLPLVSVRTSGPIAKNLLFAVMNLLAQIEVEAPIKIGDTLVANVLDTKANVVATKNVVKCA